MDKIIKNKETIAFLFLVFILIFGALNLVSAAKTIYFSANSTDIAYINAKVGIGTPTPNRNLHIYDAITNAEIDIQSISGTNNHWAFYHDSSSNSLRIWYYIDKAESNLLNLLVNGNVGISTTSPAAKLSVTGGVNATNYACNRTAGLSGTYSDVIPKTFTICGGLWTVITSSVNASLNYTGNFYNAIEQPCTAEWQNGILVSSDCTI